MAEQERSFGRLEIKIKEESNSAVLIDYGKIENRSLLRFEPAQKKIMLKLANLVNNISWQPKEQEKSYEEKIESLKKFCEKERNGNQPCEIIERLALAEGERRGYEKGLVAGIGEKCDACKADDVLEDRYNKQRKKRGRG